MSTTAGRSFLPGPVEVHPPEKEGSKYGAKLIYRGTPVGEEVVVHHSEVIWEGPPRPIQCARSR